MSLQTNRWGLGWLASSEDVSGQEVRARARQGQGETGESGREGSLGCGLAACLRRS